jgi:hypothetical protein
MKTTYIFLIILVFFGLNLNAQDDKSNNLEETGIIIYTEYTPVLKDANRMQFLPVIIDTAKIEPIFDYKVQPVLFKTNFKPTPITAASLSGESLKPLDNGLIKIGMGNYLSPIVEVYYNTTRQRNFSAGAFAKHHSAFGKVKNTANQKIFSGFNNNLVNAYGKRFFYSSTLGGDISFKSNQSYFYGYDPNIILASGIDKPRDREEMEMQRFNKLKANINFISNNSSAIRMNFNSNLTYQYFFTASKDFQHKIKLDADLNKLINQNRYGMDLGFVFDNNHIMSIDYNEIFLDLNPYFKHYTENWQILLGANTTGELNADPVKYHFYPNIYFQHNISNTIIPYASFKGYIQNNNLEFLSDINPFINNYNDYQVTNYAQVIDLGIKGNISRKVFFHLNGNYSKIDNMGFFVNDTSTVLKNKFILEYTNVERFAGYGEIALNNLGEKLSINLKGHYYYYSYIKNREKPWHMPNFDISLNTNYKFDSKLNFGINADLIGTRYAKEFDTDLSIIEKKLKPIIDISLYGEYSFASNFQSFLQLNNITGQKQYVWNNYMSHGFNFMLGLKYLF